MIQGQFAQFDQEIQNIKSEIATRVQFEALEDRVFKLEIDSANAFSFSVKRLYAQLDRIDPAFRRIALEGLKEMDIKKRETSINKLLSDALL